MGELIPLHVSCAPAPLSSPALPEHLTPAQPSTYTLELTAACNHSCVGCGNVFPHRRVQLSGADWLRLIDRIRPYASALRITGGECTLHPDFAAIIHACDQLGVPFVIFSNGNWRRRSETLRLLASCSHLEGLLISLHGHNAVSYKMFVGRDSFEAVCETIVAVVKAGIRVVTNSILLTTTIDHLAEIADRAFCLGASAAAFSRYYGTSLPNLEPDPAQLRDALQELAILRRRDPRILLNNCVPACFAEDLPTRGCTSGLTHCAIDPLGNVRPCTHAPVILGNALTDDITTIWRSSQLAAWRGQIPSACISCSAFERCRGGCRATAMHRALSCDPLIADSPKTTQSIRLHGTARPQATYHIREAGPVCYLIAGARQAKLSAHALPVLRALDGHTTLEMIRTRFGQPGLDLIGTLIKAGLVELQ